MHRAIRVLKGLSAVALVDLDLAQTRTHSEWAPGRIPQITARGGYGGATSATWEPGQNMKPARLDVPIEVRVSM